MNPSTMVYYMAERNNRERLDAEASRGWLATQAAAQNNGRQSTGLIALAERTVMRFTRGGDRKQQVTTASPATLLSVR